MVGVFLGISAIIFLCMYHQLDKSDHQDDLF